MSEPGLYSVSVISGSRLTGTDAVNQTSTSALARNTYPRPRPARKSLAPSLLGTPSTLALSGRDGVKTVGQSLKPVHGREVVVLPALLYQRPYGPPNDLDASGAAWKLPNGSGTALHSDTSFKVYRSRVGYAGVAPGHRCASSTSPHVPPSYPDDNRKGLGSEREGYSNREMKWKS